MTIVRSVSGDQLLGQLLVDLVQNALQRRKTTAEGASLQYQFDLWYTETAGFALDLGMNIQDDITDGQSNVPSGYRG